MDEQNSTLLPDAFDPSTGHSSIVQSAEEHVDHTEKRELLETTCIHVSIQYARCQKYLERADDEQNSTPGSQ